MSSDLPASRIVLAGISLTGIGRAVLNAAAQAEQILAHGRACGLTDEDTREVVRVWSEWYRCTPWPIDWRRVHTAVVDRSLGGEWRPT